MVPRGSQAVGNPLDPTASLAEIKRQAEPQAERTSFKCQHILLDIFQESNRNRI